MDSSLTLSQLPDWWRTHTPPNRPLTIGLGGGGLSRKPLGLLAQLIECDCLQPSHWVTPVGGPDVDVLIAYDLVDQLTASYVGFDDLGLAPHFRAARQSGALAWREWSEFGVVAGLRAAGERLPFYPARLGGDIVETAGFEIFTAPYSGESLAAIPALPLDVAVLHVDAADRHGNACILGDLHVDPLLARVAQTTLISTEQLVETQDIRTLAGRAGCELLAIDVDAVIELPGGYGFCAAPPERMLDQHRARAYLTLAAEHLAGKAVLEALIPALGGADR